MDRGCGKDCQAHKLNKEDAWIIAGGGNKYMQIMQVLSGLPTVLWRCWLGGRKSIWPVKNWVVGCWHGYWSGAKCRLAYGPADSTATHFSCFSKIQIGFTFLVPAHPGSPGQRAVKRVCVCVVSGWPPVAAPVPLLRHVLHRTVPQHCNHDDHRQRRSWCGRRQVGLLAAGFVGWCR